MCSCVLILCQLAWIKCDRRKKEGGNNNNNSNNNESSVTPINAFTEFINSEFGQELIAFYRGNVTTTPPSTPITQAPRPQGITTTTTTRPALTAAAATTTTTQAEGNLDY